MFSIKMKLINAHAYALDVHQRVYVFEWLCEFLTTFYVIRNFYVYVYVLRTLVNMGNGPINIKYPFFSFSKNFKQT